MAEDFVSQDRDRIFKLIKEHKGSRFKSFQSFDDALDFVQDSCDTKLSSQPNGTRSVESLPFPSIDTKSLSRFKRAIESKNLDSVKCFVRSNPLYLISNYFDSPTILMQGPRYNAAHLAVRSKASEILNYILETVNSLDFIKQLYPDLNEESLASKRNHLLDLYLNAPDKINCDTPLHWACKKGCLECISILTSYVPICDTKRPNKNNKLPENVIETSTLRSQIEELLNSHMFITLLSDSDHEKRIVKQTVIGRKVLDFSLCDKRNSRTVSAIVGPLTPEKANSVYETLKSPQKCSPEQRKLRLQDPERGLEKATRNLCFKIDVPFEEYLPFLGQFTDLRTKKGLAKLNHHLRKVHDEQMLNEVFSKLTLNQANSVESFSIVHDDDPRCEEKEDSNEEEEEYRTAPSSPISNHIQIEQYFIEGSRINQIDFDVAAAIKLALDQKSFTIDELSGEHPFLSHWYQQVAKLSH